jgi:hypothetical protein
MEWINLATNSDQWRGLVNIDEPSGSIKVGKFLCSRATCSFQEGLSSVKLLS